MSNLICFYFILFYFVLSRCCYLLEAYSFLIRDGNGVDPERKGGGENGEDCGGGENNNRYILYEQKSVFKKRKK